MALPDIKNTPERPLNLQVADAVKKLVNPNLSEENRALERGNLRKNFVGALEKAGAEKKIFNTSKPGVTLEGVMIEGTPIGNIGNLDSFLDKRWDKKNGKWVSEPELMDECQEVENEFEKGVAEGLMNSAFTRGKMDKVLKMDGKTERDQQIDEIRKILGGNSVLSGIEERVLFSLTTSDEDDLGGEEPEIVVTKGEGADSRLIGVLERLEERLGGGEDDGLSEADRKRRRKLEEQQIKFYEEEMQFKGEMEEVSEVEWLDGLMGKDYEKAQIPARWMLRAPEWMERKGKNESEMMGEWRDVYSLAEGLSYAVVRRRTDGKFQTDVDYIKEIIFGMYAMKEKRLKKYYEQKEFSYGFRNALETLVIDLFEPSDQGIFVFKKREDNNSVDRFMLDSAAYKENLAERLLRSGEFKSLEQAKIMISIASDFLEMGGQYEVGDSERDVGYASDALRTALRPDVKFGKKLIGGEIWGGPIGMWAMTVAGNDAKRAKQLIDGLGITPKVLGGSVLNMMVEVEGSRDKVPLGFALLNRKNVVFESNANDFYFTWKKDFVMNSIDVWKYVNGDKKLEMRSIADLSNVVADWRKGLYNAVWGLRKQSKKTGIDFAPKEVLAAAIAGSTTVWPFDGVGGFNTLYMRIDKSDEAISRPSFKDDYVDAGDFIIRNTAQSDAERLWLMNFFGVNKKGANDLFQKAVDYDFVTNGTVDLKERQKVQSGRNWKLV